MTLGVAQALGWIGAIALALALPRYLGDVGLGKFAFAFAITRLVGLTAELGTATYLAKTIAQDRSRASGLAAALVLRLPLGAIAALMAMAVARSGAHDAASIRVVDVLAYGLIVDAALTVVQGALQGHGRMRAYATCGLVSKLGFGALGTAAVMSGGGPVGVALSWVGAQTVALAVGFAFLGPVRLEGARELGAWRTVLLGGLPFFIWQGALMVYGQIDAVILSFVSGDAAVGWYSAAYRIVTIPGALPTILMTVLLPALAAAAVEPARLRRLTRRAVEAAIVLTVPTAIGTAVLAAQIIDAVGYPAAFQHSVVLIILLAPSLPLVAVDMMVGTALNASDRQRRWAMVAVAAAVLNPLVNIVAIPLAHERWGNGAIAAAGVTTATELFLLVAGILLLPRRTLDRATLGFAARVGAAGAVMGLALIPARDLPIIVPVTLGAVVYCLASLALRTVTADDLRQIARHVRPRTPARVLVEVGT